MDLKITDHITPFLLDKDDPTDYSASVNERGANAGRDTWQNCLDSVSYQSIINTVEEFNAAIDYFVALGGWSREEINSWTCSELNAIVYQEMVAQFREYKTCKNRKQYDQQAREGKVSGRLWYDIKTKDWFLNLSS